MNVIGGVISEKVRVALARGGLFRGPYGVNAIVDGQFGSTGKGLAASVLAYYAAEEKPAIGYVTSNAGPNSGHTSYFCAHGRDPEKIVLRQLPTFSAISSRIGRTVPAYLNAGAVIDAEVLRQECSTEWRQDIFVHPLAALVTEDRKTEDQTLVGRIGSTGKGTGAAIAAKVMRDESAVYQDLEAAIRTNGLPPVRMISRERIRETHGVMEVSQGFSLGVNQRFYPFCTSRECTVTAALSDAGIHPAFLSSTMMVVRTFPIRVAGNSGAHYPDQRETTWESMGVEPERTTVTNKVRRIFTWSDLQYRDALEANRPDYIFVNFCNYLREDVNPWVVQNIVIPYMQVLNCQPKAVLLGYGPTPTDVSVLG
jgi:adenylosuccinate synthase